MEACVVCDMKGENFCGSCRAVRYCSKEHQKMDWKNHKLRCFPCRAEENEVLGRFLKSTRDIKAGEVIFIDSPLVVGPKQVTEPMCLSCFNPVDGRYNCEQCGWPMCSPKCQSSPTHIPECKLSQKRESRIRVNNFGEHNPMYECITPLRCLWLMDNFPERWSKVTKMEAHMEERKKSEKYKLNQINVVDFIRKFLKLDYFSEEHIHFVCGVMEVNGFEIPGPGLVGLYPFACLLEHSCLPNTTRTFNSRLQLVVRAAIDIPAGDHITTNYTDTLWGVRDRRLHLMNSKYFVCSCRRCQDATDLETHLSSLKCRACPQGLCPPPDDPQAPWTCSSCSHTYPSDEVDELLKKYGERLINLKGRIGLSEKFLKESKNMLSENHQYRCEVKMALVQIYGRERPDAMNTVSHDILQRKIFLTKELLKLADLFSPGYSRLRGTLLYEVQGCLCEQYRRLRKKQQQGAKGISLLQEAERALCEVVKILQSDSHLRDEVHVAVEAEEELKIIRNLLTKKS